MKIIITSNIITFKNGTQKALDMDLSSNTPLVVHDTSEEGDRKRASEQPWEIKGLSET